MVSLRRFTVMGLLAVATTGALLVQGEYRRGLDLARSRVAGGKLLATHCGPIEYTEQGSGPPILAVHGAGGGFDQGALLAAPLASSGHRVIAMSRFGYLRTPVPPDPSLAAQAAAHACLLDALHIPSAAVVAWSAGAPSALEFALEHPERCRALILFVPGWYPPERRHFEPPGPLQALVFDRLLRSDFFFWSLTRLSPSLAARTVLGTNAAVIAAAGPRDRARVTEMLERILPVSQRQAGLLLESRLTVEDLSGPLESLAVPTLTISAEDDLYQTYANATYIAQHVPRGQFIGYRSGGHMLIGHDQEAAAAAVEFLRRQD